MLLRAGSPVGPGPNPTRMAAVSSTRALTPAAQPVATQDASHRPAAGAALPPDTPAARASDE